MHQCGVSGAIRRRCSYRTNGIHIRIRRPKKSTLIDEKQEGLEGETTETLFTWSRQAFVDLSDLPWAYFRLNKIYNTKNLAFIFYDRMGFWGLVFI